MRNAWMWILLANVAAAQKQAPDRTSHEQEVIITASPLRPQDVFDTSYSADVVTSGDIQERTLSRTLPDALKETPGVSVQKTAYGHGSPFIRGFTGFRNVMLIDGIRLNNSVFRDGPNQYWNTVDEFLIDRLEVVRGPSSVLYGSDSIGGTVCAYTKEPSSFDPGLHVHGRSFYRYASAEDSHSVREESWGNEGDFGWFVGGTYRDLNDLVGGRGIGEMPHTGYDEYDADAKFVARTAENAKLIVAVQHTRQDDVPRTHRTIASKSWHGTAVGTDRLAEYDQERDLFYIQHRATFQGGVIDALNANVSWSRTAERFNRITGASVHERRDLEVDTPAVWVQAGKQMRAGYFTGGVEYYRDNVDSEGHDWLADGTLRSFARGEVADDAAYGLFGVYLQDEFSVGRLDVIPGIRTSRADVDADGTDPDPTDAVVFDTIDDAYRAVTGSVRLLYHVDDHWNLIGGWGMGFRAPSLDDSTAVKLVMSGSMDLPAAGLDPEKSHTFDLGVRSRQDRWEAGAFAFTTLLDDFIQRVPAGDFNGDGIADFTKDNFSEGYVYGFEAQGRFRATDEVTLFADWGYAKGEVDALVGNVESRQPLSKVGPSLAHFGVRYEPPGSKGWVEGVATAAAHQHSLSPSDTADTQRIPPGGTPGYTVFGMRGGYRVTEAVTATAAVENITDKNYRIHGSGQNEPGTNFVLGLDARF